MHLSNDRCPEAGAGRDVTFLDPALLIWLITFASSVAVTLSDSGAGVVSSVAVRLD